MLVNWRPNHLNQNDDVISAIQLNLDRLALECLCRWEKRISQQSLFSTQPEFVVVEQTV